MGEENTANSGIAGFDAVASMHEFRKEIDANIKKAKALLNNLNRRTGARELALAHTKLQEAKMWVGKVLEELGAPFPKDLRDSAE